MKPAVLFAAKSTEDTKGSIPDQLADGRRLAEQRGLEVVSEHQDEAKSAYHGDRGPGLAAAMADCERLVIRHGSCALVVQHSDRLARGDAKQARHLIEIVLWALKHDVELLSVQDPEILAGGDMALLLGAVGGMRNHQDSKRKGQAVKAGLRRRAVDRRRFTGGRRPYGYRHRDRTEEGRGTGPLVIDEAEAGVVRRIFGEFVAGKSQRGIAIGLNEDGVPTLTGTRWYATTISGMLTNSLYIGHVRHNGESYEAAPDAIPPIIDQELWQRAVEVREAKAASPNRGRGRRTVGSHLLTDGLLRCTCGAPLSTVSKRDYRGRPYTYDVYACARRLHGGADVCHQKPLKRSMIDGAVLAFFENVAVDIEQNRQAVAALVERKRAEHDALRQQAESELAKTQAALRRIEADYVGGLISADQWARLEDRLKGELEASQAEVEQFEQRDRTAEAAMDAYEADAALLEALAQTRMRMAGEIVDGVDLEPTRQALRRLFVGFELCSPAKPFGSGVLAGEGVIWCPPQEGDQPKLDGGYSLLPVVRSSALDREAASFDQGFPALKRGPLPLSDNFCSLLPAW